MLNVSGLQIRYGPDQPQVVDGIGFPLARGQTLAVVGESGSGKSTVAMALTNLLPREAITRGTVEFNGESILGASEKRLRAIRGSRIGYIFQEPSAAINPAFSVGWQLEETLRRHRPEVTNRRETVIEALLAVGVREAPERLRAYPDEFSGGMLQRVLIAQALLAEPDLLIADEPTTALDVTIQAQIMELLRQVRAERRLTMILITHNLGLVHGFADQILVMQQGRMLEYGPTESVLRYPVHAYTKGLLDCVPRLGDTRSRLPELVLTP